MHERTRRHLCQLLFLVLGLGPAVATVAWCGYRVSPVHAAAERLWWEQQIEHQTGLLTQLDRVETPWGGGRVFHQLRLVDPDGGATVAQIRQVEIVQRPQGWLVVLSQPEVWKGQFSRVWNLLTTRVLQGPAPATAIQVSTGEITLEVNGQAQTFRAARCTLSAGAGSEGVSALTRDVQADLEFQLAGDESPRPARLVVERVRRVTPARTRWTLQTDIPLPCHLFGEYLPGLASLGERARFQGAVAVVQGTAAEPRAWSCELSGDFTEVELGTLTAALPQRLTGLATLHLDRALFEQGNLKGAQGALLSPAGTVSRRLVDSLAQELSLEAEQVVLASDRPLMWYDQLGVQFELRAEYIWLSGLDPQSRDVWCRSQGRPLLAGTPGVKYPWATVVNGLFPDSGQLVPAHTTAVSLLNLVPLPAQRTNHGTWVRLSGPSRGGAGQPRQK